MPLLRDHKRARFYRFQNVFIFTLLLLVFGIAVATPPASGYEISIYAVYPQFFWFLLVVIISCGIIIMVNQVFTETPSRSWMTGFLAIVFADLIILLLPIIRGYVTFGRGDVLSHIGHVKNILYTAHVFSSNRYPVIHVLTANLSLLTSLTPELLSMIIPIIFTLFYMISVHLLARILSSQRGQVLLITAFGSVLLFRGEHTMLAPSVQCFYLLPFVLYLFLKAKKSTQPLFPILTFILVLSVIPLFHLGEGTFFLILTFFGFPLAIFLHQRGDYIKKINPIPSMNNMLVYYSILIIFIIWFYKLSDYPYFSTVLRQSWNALINGTGESAAAKTFSTLGKANLSVSQFIHLFLNMFGHVLIYCLIGIVLVIDMLKKYVYNKVRFDIQQLTFSILFILFFILLFITFFTKLLWVGYGREMRYLIFSATLLNGIGLHSFFRNKYRGIGTIFIIIVLMATSIIGVFNVHPSPSIRYSNSQVTNMEMTGITWFFTYRYNNLLSNSIHINQLRFSHVVHGYQAIRLNIPNIAQPPDHFGYDVYDTYAKSFSNDRYYVDSILSRIYGPYVLPEYSSVWSFSPDDFSQLDHSDFSVDKVFLNGEFWVYYIQGRDAIS